MKTHSIALLVAVLFWPSLSAESEVGSVCIAPIPQEMLSTASPEGVVCQKWNLLVKIDDMKAVSWPRTESAKIVGLDLTRRHRVLAELPQFRE